ncbi:MAG: protein phosphatase 2C domain-containing protein [Tannerella sp.]|jgi:protein phosphatase|nr:protein phosphatase 2C domain-containing protein [Tannerella sp.]
MTNKVHFQLTAGTDVGLQRSNNEDNFVVNANLAGQEWFIPKDRVSHITLREKGCLLVVADGMGGMNAGEVASGIAIDSIQKSFLPENITDDVIRRTASIKDFMTAAIVSADNAIREHARENPDTLGMGTTIIMAWILDKNVYVSWCGDSRAYSFHPESGLIRLSKDHSYVQELVDSGRLDDEAAFSHPNSNIITRSLGDPGETAVPDFVGHGLCDGEVILLCTDGLSGMLRDRAIEGIMTGTAGDVDVCKNTLIESALREGGQDNVTVALCKIIPEANVADEAGRGAVADTADGEAGKPKRPRKSPVVKLILIVAILLFCLIALGLYCMRYIYNPEP